MQLALAMLAGVAASAARVSEIFVESVQNAAKAFGMTPAFPGFIVVALLVAGLAGCASGLATGPNRPRADPAPYVGLFTGEFVDGRPLYRFPTIEVVGTRTSIGPGN